jgi:hypothetical protein
MSAWQRVLDETGPDGQVSKSMALAAFVLAIGPLPGVPQPPGAAQTIPDGSAAVRWLLDYYSELTPGQRSAARRLLDLADPSEPLTSEVTGPAAGDGPLPATPADLAAESAAVQQISSKMNHYVLTLKVQIFENQRQVYGADTDAYTIPLDSNGGWNSQLPAAKCLIYLNPRVHRDEVLFHSTMIHEVFHCFEAQLSGPIANFYRPGNSWLIEGAAAWVESDLVAQNVNAGARWDTYFDSPGKSLFSREYDALGFFGHLYAGEDVSPWEALPAMLRQRSNAAAYQAAGIGAGFLDTEASVFFGNPHLGEDWYQNGNQGDPSGVAAANVPLIAGPASQAAVAQAQTVTFSAAPYTDKIVRLQLLATATEVIVVRGYVRLRNADGSFEEVNPAGELCTTASGHCACPPATTSSLPEFGDAGDLAIAGGPSGAEFRVTGLSQKDVCSPPPPPAARCLDAPDFGVQVNFNESQDIGFDELICEYSTAQTGGVPVGFILIETYPRPSAAEAAWKRGGINGEPQPGFSVPVLTGPVAGCPDCSRHEFALSGYRIYEIAEIQTPGIDAFPSLEETNFWMHELLTEG